MTSKHTGALDAFAALGLDRFLTGLGASDTLVTSAPFQAALEDKIGPLSCRVLTPASAHDLPNDVGVSVIVFWPDDELSVTAAVRVKQKRAKQQRAKQRMVEGGGLVVSCLYDLLPLVAAGTPVASLADVAGARSGKRAGGSPAPESPLLLLSLPYADAEYLVDLMDSNGLPAPREHITPEVAALLMADKRASLPRFLLALVRALPQDGRTLLHIKTDVYKALIESEHLTVERAASWIVRSKADVLYFTRRDKAVQSCVQIALKPKGYRRAKSVPAMERGDGMMPVPSYEAFSDALTQLMEEEVEIEQLLETGGFDFRSVTLEETVESPVDVLKSLAQFCQKKLPKAIQLPDYGDHYRGLAGLADQAADFRRRFIEELGLRRDETGTLVTPTLLLHRELKRKSEQQT